MVVSSATIMPMLGPSESDEIAVARTVHERCGILHRGTFSPWDL